MKNLIMCMFLVTEILTVSAQSETHDFITYDTLFNVGYANLTYRFRITRPRNMFTSGHPDAAPRPAIIHMGGAGEAGTNYLNLQKYGPHYWMNNGWDGGIQLGNGIHYPIIISVQPSEAFPQTKEILMILNHLLNTYHIKRNSVHLAGFSQGGFAWTALICHQNSPGDETGMKLVTSIVALEGVSNTVSAAYANYESPGWSSFATWASKYKGKFFGLEGTADGRDVWRVSQPMNQAVPGSAYFAFENIGGGKHCCWNTMYDPARTNWRCIDPLGPNIATNTYYPNTMGTYTSGYVFQWMLRQGDTSMVGSTTAPPPNQPPVANAGTDQTITLPANSVTLSGNGTDADGSIVAYSWTKVSGGAATINSPSSASTTVSGLSQGNYTFRLTVTDNQNTTAFDDVNVTVNASSSTPPPTTQIQAENWSAMSGVQTAPTADVSGGLDVGWIDAGDWMEYAVSAPVTGSYTLNLRLATPYYGAQFQIKRSDGTVLATVNVPVTGGFNQFVTYPVTISLAAGNQTLRIVEVIQTSWNFNWLELVPPSSSRTLATATGETTTTTTSAFIESPSTITDKFVATINNTNTGTVDIQLINEAGVVSKEFKLKKSRAASTQFYLSAKDLAAGNYTIKVQMGDWTESKKIKKQ